MKRTGTCPKCNSTDVVADAKVIDRVHNNQQLDMSIATFRNPEAIFFTGQQETKVSAWVCAGCGFVEFYADNPLNIKLQED
jgi:predicted nucleic-acid-binding Zn-ribbon protein